MRRCRASYCSESRPDIIAQQVLEECLGFGAPAAQCVGGGQPEAAGQEGAFGSRHAVAAALSVTMHEPVAEQVTFDRPTSAEHPVSATRNTC